MKKICFVQLPIACKFNTSSVSLQLQRRHEQMKKNLEAQHKELEEKRRVFEDERANWETQQRLEQQKLEASRYSFVCRLTFTMNSRSRRKSAKDADWCVFLSFLQDSGEKQKEGQDLFIDSWRDDPNSSYFCLPTLPVRTQECGTDIIPFSSSSLFCPHPPLPSSSFSVRDLSASTAVLLPPATRWGCWGCFLVYMRGVDGVCM